MSDGSMTKTPMEQANTINQFFARVFTEEVGDIPESCKVLDKDIHRQQMTEVNFDHWL